MHYDKKIRLNERIICKGSPAYFIADVASNHDGDIEKAKELIWQAKEAGADAVKFQHFLANKIVSDYGFKSLGGSSSHQALWKKSVFEVYQECECNRIWSSVLIETAKKAGIDFFTTPYDIEAVELLDQHVPAYKIGSGDITWIDFIKYIAQKNKPVFLATGASDLYDVKRAVDTVLEYNPSLVLMQCNTNYTGSRDNFSFINLNVLKSFGEMYPDMVLGLSDHTPGHSTVLGAVALGAVAIEKHFTLDNALVGPDHAFSMTPKSWYEMVSRTRELEFALGDGTKRVEENEKDTVVLQRRCMRLKNSVKKNTVLTKEMVEALRPAPVGTVLPYMMKDVLGKRLLTDKVAGDALFLDDLE